MHIIALLPLMLCYGDAHIPTPTPLVINKLRYILRSYQYIFKISVLGLKGLYLMLKIKFDGK